MDVHPHFAVHGSRFGVDRVVIYRPVDDPRAGFELAREILAMVESLDLALAENNATPRGSM